jgi:hypothetical protein
MGANFLVFKNLASEEDLDDGGYYKGSDKG